jgi:hypothetical protein
VDDRARAALNQSLCFTLRRAAPRIHGRKTRRKGLWSPRVIMHPMGISEQTEADPRRRQRVASAT